MSAKTFAESRLKQCLDGPAQLQQPLSVLVAALPAEPRGRLPFLNAYGPSMEGETWVQPLERDPFGGLENDRGSEPGGIQPPLIQRRRLGRRENGKD